MKLIAKLANLIKAVARGPASQPGKSSPGSQPGTPPVDGSAARLDTARQDSEREAPLLTRERTLDQELENERVADLLERRQTSADADRPARERGERR